MQFEKLPTRYNSVIVCKNQQRRSLLQQGLVDLRAFEIIRHCTTLADAQAKFNEGSTWHLVLIAPDYPFEEVTVFLEATRAFPKTVNAVQILLSDSETSNPLSPWKDLHIDGYLVAPYTMDSFKDLVALVGKILQHKLTNKKQRSFTIF